MKAARMKLRMTAGPASSMAAAVPRRSPVPMEPPTATIVICPAVSWRRRPDSAFEDEAGMRARTRISEAGGKGGGEKAEGCHVAELRSAWTAGGGCPYAIFDGRGARPHMSFD